MATVEINLQSYPCRGYLSGFQIVPSGQVTQLLDLYWRLRQLLLPGGRFLLADPRRPAARYFCHILIEQDYRHSVQTRKVRWKSTAHQVHIHVFDNPP